MKISLIIPVYNVASYLRRCLDSCFDQNLDESDYEVIVVNDGSTDNSLEIIKTYLNQHSNMLLIDKENGGLSSARNSGLRNAKGEFVWFIDSDDWIKINCLKEIVDVLSKSNAEVLTFVAKGSDGKCMFDFSPCRKLESNQIVDGLGLYKAGYFYPYSGAPFYVFKRSFLENNNLSFYEGILFEDLLFCARMMSVLNSCIYVNANYYYYYSRNGSISKSSASVKKAFDHIIIAKELANLVEKKKKQNDYVLYVNIAMSILGIYVLWFQLYSDERRQIRNLFISQNFWLRSIVKSRSFRYLIPYVLLKFNLHIRIK